MQISLDVLILWQYLEKKTFFVEETKMEKENIFFVEKKKNRKGKGEKYLENENIFLQLFGWPMWVSIASPKTSDQFILKPESYVWVSEGMSPKAGKIELLLSQAKGPRNRPPFEIIFGLN